MLKEIIITLGMLTASFAVHVSFFRRDYHYNREYDSFYKFNLTSNISYEEASETCMSEGSKLFYPKSSEEMKIIRPFIGLLDPAIREYILVGFYNEVGFGELITVDGLPTPVPLIEEEGNRYSGCVFMNIDDGATRIDTCSQPPEGLKVRGFVCKREIDISSCPTIDKGYEYEETTKKCYKLNKNEKTWINAMKTCFMEGGSLLVTRNREERATVTVNLLRNKGLKREATFFVGYHKSLINNKFYTVKGETLNDGFYVENIIDENSNNNCGAFVYSGNYNDGNVIDKTYPCEFALPFICEMNAN